MSGWRSGGREGEGLHAPQVGERGGEGFFWRGRDGGEVLLVCSQRKEQT